MGVLAAGSPSAAGAQEVAAQAEEPRAPVPSRGPLRVQERNPLYRLFLSPVAESADLVGPGRWEAHLSTSYSNIFELSDSPRHAQYFDLERLAILLTLRYGLAPKVEVGMSVGMRTDWGGFLDRFIRGWHDAFGFPQGNRDDAPDGAHGLILVEGGARRVDLEAGTAWEDVRAFAGWSLAGSRDARRALTLRGALKLPVGGVDRGTSGRMGGSLELAGRVSGRRTHLHGSLGAVHLRPPDRLEPFTRDWALTASLGVEHALSPAVAFAGQLVGGSAYVGGFGAADLDRIPLNLVVGLTGRVARGWGWQASFAEDLVARGPSVDFTLDLQISRRWGGG